MRRFFGLRRSEPEDEGPPSCLLLLEEGQERPTSDDELVVAPLYDLGWEVACSSWRASVDWAAFDAVVIRSTWDYHRHADAFLDAVRAISESGARLLNPLGLVEWNVHKTYLRELESHGIPIVPTLWRDQLERGGLERLLDAMGGEDMVIKPVVGATASDTYRVSRSTVGPISRQVEQLYAERPLLAQPLVTGILEHGEYSLFYFGGDYSHAIRKTARPGDFRVQTEFGGRVDSLVPPGGLRAFADRVVAALPAPAAYARVDVVHANDDDGFWLMEVELIEPELYLRVDPAAPRRLAEAIVAASG